MIRSLMKKLTIVLVVAGLPVFLIAAMSHGAAISDSYPGYPNAWDGLTTSSIIKIDLDTPVALIGGQPDMVYHVKAATFSGFDFILTDVSCDVEVSGDGKTIRLYPQNSMDNNSLFAYKIENINFAGGGSSQTDSRFFTTGDNPVPVLNTYVDEGDMCGDVDGKYGPGGLSFGNFCARCHESYKGVYVDCIITP
jgi:hypothetical protein